MAYLSTMLRAVLAAFVLISFSEANDKNAGRGDEKLLIPVKYLQVTTNTLFQVVSSTVYPFCITGTFALAPVCSGKRRRRSLPINADAIGEERGVKVDSSEPTSLSSNGEASIGDREKFFKFTIWNTASFTTSITLLYTNSASSISLSYVCYAPNMSMPPLCG